jgi:hypothetical protein
LPPGPYCNTAIYVITDTPKNPKTYKSNNFHYL